jgi:NDP-sugar pyrophosphorylase family protein
VSLPIAIIAGGLATRLGSLTEQLPKILLEVAGRPFAEHQLALLQKAGIARVVYCVGHLGRQVEDTLGDGSRWGMTFDYIHDGPQLTGTGGAVLRALPRLGKAFFVMYGDSYLDCDYSAIERSFVQSGLAGLMTVFANDDRWDRSNVEYRSGRIVRYDKGARTPDMRHIDYGLGVLTPGAFEAWKNKTGPLDLGRVYQALIERESLAGYDVPTRFYEIGSLEGLADTRALLSTRVKAVQ